MLALCSSMNALYADRWLQEILLSQFSGPERKLNYLKALTFYFLQFLHSELKEYRATIFFDMITTIKI